MLKSDKVKFMISKLEELYPKVDVPLDHKDPYTLLIAVLMSAPVSYTHLTLPTKRIV